MLAPGGRLLIVDFAPHDLEFLREEFAHERLGFPDAQVRQWLADAGLDARRGTRHWRRRPGRCRQADGHAVGRRQAGARPGQRDKPAAVEAGKQALEASADGTILS